MPKIKNWSKVEEGSGHISWQHDENYRDFVKVQQSRGRWVTYLPNPNKNKESSSKKEARDKAIEWMKRTK
jgi:hypothetical protein